MSASIKDGEQMSKKEKVIDISKKVDGLRYLEERNDIWDLAKKEGVVIVFGFSDDNIEFRGAIDDEIGCYDGSVVTVPGTNEHISALWCGMINGNKAVEENEYTTEDGSVIPWTYKVREDLPHETFMMYEDDGVFCRGIVFCLEDCQ